MKSQCGRYKEMFKVLLLMVGMAHLGQGQVIPQGSNDLFADSFTREADPGTLLPWQVRSGNWLVTRGVFQSGPNQPQSYGLAYVSGTWTNYLAQARFQFPAGGFGGGIEGDLDPATGARYGAWIYPEGSSGGSSVVKLVKFQNWTTFGYMNVNGMVMQQASLPGVGTNWHTLKLAFAGKQIAIYYDGIRVLNAEDVEAQPYLGGGIAVETWTDSAGFTMLVDDVAVSLLAMDDTYSLVANSSLTVDAPGVLANDTALSGTDLSALLVRAPTNGTVNLNSNGGFFYTPKTNFNGLDSFTYQANDGVANLGTATATIVIGSSHNGPALPVVANVTLNELTLLTVTNTARDTDFPPPALTYRLLSGPSNATISTNGVITWTPTEAQGPSTNVFTTLVADNGSPPLSATNTFTVIVKEVNSPPILPVQTARTIAESTTLTVTNTAIDSDIPANVLSYSLLSGPTNAAISANGVITWTPTETQGPSTNVFTTLVVDSGSPPLSATNSFTVVVREVNSPPVLPVQTAQTAAESTTLTVTNTAIDSDIPANVLSYSLLSGPTNAAISTNGVITWTPTKDQVPSTQVFTTLVTDFNPWASSAQHLSATNTFVVTVSLIANPVDRYVIHRYYPLHAGDFKQYSGAAGNLTLSVSRTNHGGQAVLAEVNSGGQTRNLFDYSETQLRRLALTGGGLDFVLDSPLPYLDDVQLLSGAIRTTKGTAIANGVQYNVTQTATAKDAGTVSVPAGTFEHCRAVSVTLILAASGSNSITLKQSLMLAPEVGPIRLTKVNDLSQWFELVSGQVDRVNVSNLAAASALAFPVVITQPKDQTVLCGASAFFQAAGDGSAPLGYQWLKNGTNILEGGRASGVTSAKLTLSDARPEDAGAYSVLLTNQTGWLRSVAATLTVTPDTIHPALVIVSPARNSRFNTASMTVRGTAADNVRVAQVMYQVNGGAWTPATGASPWTASAALRPGSNTFRAYALDPSGNSSTTNTLPLFFAPGCPLALMIAGNGTVTPLTNGQVLEWGKQYTIRASPRPGSLFSQWTGGLTSANPMLTFVMASNLSLTAHFVTNPFPALKGNYTGLFYDTNTPSFASAGTFTLVVTDRGTFSGKLQQGVSSYSLSGQLDTTLSTQKRLVRSGASDLLVGLKIPEGSGAVTGTVSTPAWASPLFGYRSTFDRTRNPAIGFQGRYTLVFPGTTAGELMGDGFAQLTVDYSGSISLTGTLSDGMTARQSAWLAGNGQWPVYLGLYGGQGGVFGWLTMPNDASSPITGTVLWSKPAGTVGLSGTGGFTNTLEATGWRYVAPPRGMPVLGLTNGVLVLEGGGLAGSLTNSCILDARNRLTITSTNPNKLTLNFSTTAGTFQGSFVHPQTGRPATIQGILLQPENYGCGFFLGPNRSGSVYLGK